MSHTHTQFRAHKRIRGTNTPQKHHLNTPIRLVGSLKTQVSFAKEPYKKDDILQKRLMFLRTPLIIAIHLNRVLLNQLKTTVLNPLKSIPSQ